MNLTMPEKVGISSQNVQKFIEILEKNNLATHDVILARGNDIFFEHYWAPFHKDFQHRMYSVSKSFVSLAIGFLEQDGLIHLDDSIEKYFPREVALQSDEWVRKQTIRHMLMMSTARPGRKWLREKTDDRVRQYFEDCTLPARPSGTLFSYDSTATFVLGALVERLTGMELMDYLRQKLFCKIGVSDEVYCLKCPGGHSWSDSAVMCTARDLLLTARFVLNGGSWNGEQILNADYVRKATTKQIDNNYSGVDSFDAQGYGYLFWMTYRNSFFFSGMGAQFAACDPDKDLILIYNADNQGKESGNAIIFKAFFDLIVEPVCDSALPANEMAEKSLHDYVASLKLLTVKGDKSSSLLEKINGATYTMTENPMGISQIQLRFDGDTGYFSYTNEQGDKEIVFGLVHNEFGLFPQEGYSDDVGNCYAPGNYYKCAASAAWVDENKLRIYVQIIDRYFANLCITLWFREGIVFMHMLKNAELFMEEYTGYATGERSNG